MQQPYNPANGQYLSPEMNKLSNSPLGQFTQGFSVGVLNADSVPFPTRAGNAGVTAGKVVSVIKDIFGPN